METRHIIVFDGVCNFCNGAVNFIIKRDPQGQFAFTPMQCDFAKALVKEKQIKNVGVDTFLLVKSDGECLVFSSAALEIAKHLTGYWYVFGVLKYVPTRIRDFVYRAFAARRYTLFGKKEACIVPSPDVRSRFIGIDSLTKDKQ